MGGLCRDFYARGYFPANNYEEEEEEEGLLLDNDYDDFGDDFFQQEDENFDEFDMPIRRFGKAWHAL